MKITNALNFLVSWLSKKSKGSVELMPTDEELRIRYKHLERKGIDRVADWAWP